MLNALPFEVLPLESVPCTVHSSWQFHCQLMEIDLDWINCVNGADDVFDYVHGLVFHHRLYPMMLNFDAVIRASLAAIDVLSILIDGMEHAHVHDPIDLDRPLDYYLHPKNDVIKYVIHRWLVDWVIGVIALGLNTVTG